MRMQTGPAANQSMKSWLVWTGCLELFNAGLFSSHQTVLAKNSEVSGRTV